jgi:hypothetical protein
LQFIQGFAMHVGTLRDKMRPLPPMKLIKFLLLLLLTSLTPPPCSAADPALQGSLERVYLDWRGAIIAKSMETWTRSTAHYRQMTTRNLITSQKLRYPDALFDLPMQPPDIVPLKLLEVEAVGPTAHLVYYGRVDLGLGIESKDLPEALLVLKFYQEKSGWKFDTSRMIRLDDAPEMKRQVQDKQPEFLKTPSFTPSGVVPTTPEACRNPDYVAALRIEAMGYEVTATMNGVVYPTVADDAVQQLIIGGLVRGDNPLKLHLKPLPIPQGEQRVLEVQAVVINGQEKKPTTRVFFWNPGDIPPAENVELMVKVNIGTLNGR